MSAIPRFDEELVEQHTQRSAIPSWAPLTGLILLMVAATRQVVRPLSDPDIWWHLRLGADFRGDWSLRNPGQLSPYATADWVPTQWIPEIIASKFEDLFGLPGVAWLMGLALLVLMSVLYRFCRREADLLPAVVATGAAVVGMSASLSPRPHMVTYVLLAVTLDAWLKTSRDLHSRWWLIPLTWLWAGSHGMWFTGVLVGVTVTAGLMLDRRVGRRAVLRLSAIPAVSVLAAALTPIGPRLLTAPFAVGEIGGFIAEWQPPSFRDIAPGITMAMVAAIVLTWSRQGRVSWVRIGLLVLATGWALLSVRTVTLAALLLAPLMATVIQSWLPGQRPSTFGRAEKLTLVAGTGTCLAALAFVLPSVAANPGAVPGALNPELDRLPAGSGVLNSYELGGWLAWRHPDVATYVDGLTEAYPPGHLREYHRLTSVAAGWDEVLARSGASYALLPDGSPLATALQQRLDWRELGSDDGYVLLQASGE